VVVRFPAVILAEIAITLSETHDSDTMVIYYARSQNQVSMTMRFRFSRARTVSSACAAGIAPPLGD
jgi:hypothetical protein